MRAAISAFIVAVLTTMCAGELPGNGRSGRALEWFSLLSGVGVRRPLFRTAPRQTIAFAEFSDGAEVSIFEVMGPMRQELVDFRWPRIASRVSAETDAREWSLLCSRFADARAPLLLDSMRVGSVRHSCRD